MNLFTKQEQSYRYQKQTYGCQSGNVGVRDKSGAQDEHTHTTMYKIDNQKDILYSTGNSTQYSMITYKKKESLKK